MSDPTEEAVERSRILALLDLVEIRNDERSSLAGISVLDERARIPMEPAIVTGLCRALRDALNRSRSTPPGVARQQIDRCADVMRMNLIAAGLVGLHGTVTVTLDQLAAHVELMLGEVFDPVLAALDETEAASLPASGVREAMEWCINLARRKAAECVHRDDGEYAALNVCNEIEEAIRARLASLSTSAKPSGDGQ